MILELSRKIKAEMKDLASNKQDSVLRDTCEALKHFHWDTVTMAKDATFGYSFEGNTTTSISAETTSLYDYITIGEIKTSEIMPCTTSSISYVIWAWI